jgi:hypothetical protein
MGQMAMCVAEMGGVDGHNLGQWAWMQFKGCQGQLTWILLAYIPCQSAGKELVFKQQARYFCQQGI